MRLELEMLMCRAGPKFYAFGSHWPITAEILPVRKQVLYDKTVISDKIILKFTFYKMYSHLSIFHATCI